MTESLITSPDNQSAMIIQMEKKLNPQTFWRRLRKHDKFCSLSSNQYWDWLTYIDVLNSLLTFQG